MVAMAAVRLLLMVLMCLVTDAPGPVTTGVFEHLEEGEEIQASRRRAAARRVAHAPSTPPRSGAIVVARVLPAPSRELAARRPVHEHAPKIPAPAPEPSTAAEDH
jgi:hypothetical protein